MKIIKIVSMLSDNCNDYKVGFLGTGYVGLDNKTSFWVYLQQRNRILRRRSSNFKMAAGYHCGTKSDR